MAAAQSYRVASRRPVGPQVEPANAIDFRRTIKMTTHKLAAGVAAALLALLVTPIAVAAQTTAATCQTWNPTKVSAPVTHCLPGRMRPPLHQRAANCDPSMMGDAAMRAQCTAHVGRPTWGEALPRRPQPASRLPTSRRLSPGARTEGRLAAGFFAASSTLRAPTCPTHHRPTGALHAPRLAAYRPALLASAATAAPLTFDAALRLADQSAPGLQARRPPPCGPPSRPRSRPGVCPTPSSNSGSRGFPCRDPSPGGPNEDD